MARRLGQWHAVLPVDVSASAPSEETPAVASHLPLLDSTKTGSVQPDDITPIQPREAGPNLWTVLQKWILALPVTTEEQRARRRTLQKELERIVAELDDGAGIGERGVRRSLVWTD